jgi:anaerobic selenocysteine-containing dehydrogenase
MAELEPPRSWGRSTVETACPLDCPDSCSLDVKVERGQVVRIDGNSRGATTDGYICGKVRKFARRVYGELRLSRPAIRTGPKGSGEFRQATWDEALDLIAGRMRRAESEHGAESVLPYHYGGSNGLLTNDFEDARLFRRFGASRLARTLCAAPTGAAARAMYGAMAGVAYEDYAEAKLVVVWGCNPSASAIHLVPHVKHAMKSGGRLVVVDPRRTPLARIADLHLPVRPGTDLPVALAVIRELFERGWADRDFLDRHTTGADALRQAAEAWSIDRAAEAAGVDATALATFAEWYGTASPAVVRCGWGQERNRNGGSATLAILALPAVAGKFGVRGGGYTMTNAAAWGIEQERLIGVRPAETRTINMSQLGRVLIDCDDPPVSLLFVYNANPMATTPDQNRVRRGLEREDLFTVVHDQVMTDTAAYADVVLPAPTFLEQYDIARGYGAYHLHIVRPAIDVVGEARSNYELFRALGVRLGLADPDDDLGSPGSLIDAASRLPEDLASPLLDGGLPRPPAAGRPVQFADVHPGTADERVHLFPDDLDARHGLFHYEPDPGTREHPLSLISPASPHTISSTLGELRPGLAKLKIHPDDAHARSIKDGDMLRLFNDLGSVECEADVTPEVRPGTVSMPKGLWRKSTRTGSTSNALVPDTLADIAGGACFNDARVQVERLDAPGQD